MKDIAVLAAKKAGAYLIASLGKRHTVSSKGFRDIVTDADMQAQQIIISTIRKKYPTHAFLSEESKQSTRKEYTWVIDPLDGTVNYANGIPFFAVALGLLHNDELVLSVVYLPLLKELFIAQKNKGATLNGKKISVSDRNSLDQCIISISPGIKTAAKVQHSRTMINALMPRSRSLVILGSTPATLAYIACGRIDTYYVYKSDIYNMTATLLVREAGGTVSRHDGSAFSVLDKELSMIASNGLVHAALLKCAKK